ncbi:MAG TPA: SpoIIE family protein phosphatase [Streptosporangiaceae bacterium]|nr:SpoIIE family protein phosphatase [Streptosporangiaceae bacterium]
MVSQVADQGGSLEQEWHGPDLHGLAVFTASATGEITSWSVTAARLFGHTAEEVIGRDVRDVLMTEQEHRDLVAQGLIAVAAGQVWSANFPMCAANGRCHVNVHCEPLAGPNSGALVIGRRAYPGQGQHLLSDAASRIGTTLDLNRTASEATDVAVPAFADACAIFVPERLLVADELAQRPVGAEIVVRRLAARLAGQPTIVSNDLLRPREAIVLSAGSPSYRAMTTRGPVKFDELDPESVARLARLPGGNEMAAVRFTSFLAVPLIARGIVLGCATFARSENWSEFSQADIGVAQELASRTAVSMDNARLYLREQRTAEALQQGLLPGKPISPAGMTVATRYLAVGANIVGGDWHDVVPLMSGRATLIVGDAMGHGPEAAAVMVQLRTAAHTLADLELPPEEILTRLDRMATSMTTAPFATCLAAVIDPVSNSCMIAKAGHLAPILTLSDGTTQNVDLPVGLPIGLGLGGYEATKITLPPGATLALFTDGLVESRSRPLDDGLAQLRDALSDALGKADHTLDLSCDQITQMLQQRGEDDITLVLARVNEAESGLADHG